MRFQYLYIIILILFLNTISITNLHSQEQESNSRPKVGLVLSGGGAKGLAHIGVLKVLEEVGMPIDYIGGTSMGSIVGGLYAAGYTARDLDSIVHSIDWNFLLSDEIPRQNLSITQKPDNDRFLLSFPINKKGVKLPEGIIRGQHLENELTKLCTPVYDIRDFSKLPIPFICIAVDIETGEKVVFRKGNLSDAMRASMSIPSAFVPMEIDGRKYVDGGIIDNFPVADVIKMGADIIIGVDVGIGSQAKKESNLLTVMEDVVFIYSNKIMKESKKSVDIFIQPDLNGYGTSSFAAGDSLMRYGEEAARKLYPQLKSLADSLNGLSGVKFTRKPQPVVDSIFITSIQIEILSHHSEKFAPANMPFSVPGWVTPEEIQEAVEYIYASAYYDKVTPELIEDGDDTKLTIHIKEKVCGQLRLGLYYDIDHKAALFLNSTLYNRLINDTKLSLTLGLGRNPTFDILYFIDKGLIPAPGVELSNNWECIPLISDSTRKEIATFNCSVTNAKLFIQSNFSYFLIFRVGGEWTHTAIKSDVSLIEFGDLSDNFWGLFSSLYADTYDHPYFPKKGQQALIETKFIANINLEPIMYYRLEYRVAQRLSKRFTLIPSVYGGITIGDSIPIQYSFPLGGLTDIDRFGHMPFIGYKYFETGNNNVFFGRLDLQFQIRNNMYLTLMGNVGYQDESLNNLFTPAGLISGFGLTYGLDTLVGPLKISVMKSGEHKGFLGYVQLGYWF